MFIIHSFTTYALFYKKLEEWKTILETSLITLLNDKLIYSTICKTDRKSKKDWFGYNDTPYLYHFDIDLVKKDIRLMKTLKYSAFR